MAIDTQGPIGTPDATGAINIPNISPLGEILVTNDSLRRIQEILLLTQQSNLLSTQLMKENTSRYTFMEIR